MWDSTPWGMIHARRKAEELKRRLEDEKEKLREEVKRDLLRELKEEARKQATEELKNELRESVLADLEGKIKKITLTKLRGFLREFTPRKEKTVVDLFRIYMGELGFYDLELGRAPSADGTVFRNGKKLRVEFEKRSSDFVAHKHSESDVDIVVCWVKDRQLPVEIFELSRELPKTQRFGMAWRV